MTKFSRPYCIVMLLQAICLVVGLWIHYHFVVSTARIDSETQVWSELATWSQQWLRELRQIDLNDLEPGNRAFEKIQSELHTATVSKQSNALFVDSDWRVRFSESTGNQDIESNWKPGEKVKWTTIPEYSNSFSESNRGTLQTSDGTRLGLISKLKNGSGYLISYRPSETPPINPSTFKGTLPVASVIAFFWTCLLQCIVAFLILSRVQSEGFRKQKKTEEKSLKSTKALLRTRDAIIFGLAKLAESRDPETGLHLERISLYSTRLADAMRNHPRYRDIVTPSFVQIIGLSSALHDIGKVGIKDSILLKPGRLTDEERLTMQEHAVIGGECIKQIESRLASSNFLQLAREIAFFHHERWDGTGYPYGLHGEQIPLAARIISIVDVYDALSSKRVYKDAWPHQKCMETILKDAGKHFDPDIVNIFMEIESQFQEIAQQFAEPEEDVSALPYSKNSQETKITLTQEQEDVLYSALENQKESEHSGKLAGTASQ